MVRFMLVLLMSAAAVRAATPSQLINVGDSVQIEVLDWGGTGRSVVLLTGFGNTAHVYEDFAPKLVECCHVHVYGITRRGYGSSSKPERGYSTPELAEDDWRVIQTLKLDKPVFIGHSMAGSEMTFLAQKHHSELRALVYVDANADPMDYPWSNAEYRTLTMRAMKGAPGPPKRTSADGSSVEAYQAYQARIGEAPFPAAEIRNMYVINPDGSVGKNRSPRYVGHEIDDGSIPKDYRGIDIPVLSLIALPRPPADKWKEHPPKDEGERRDAQRADEILMEYIHRWENNLKRANPLAKVVELPGAHHYMFLSEQAEVLREIRSFLQTLPTSN
ncbi:MAG TPA: alpha/beta hydrolase [Bryobacteraceae bacterium]